MSKEINPTMAIATIGVVVLLAVLFLAWNSLHGGGFGGRSGSGIIKPKVDMRNEAHGPSLDQQKQIEEWKKQNPGAYTRF